MEIVVSVKIRFNMPGQTKNMPNEMEEIMEEVGQQYKRELYKVVMEKADEELVSARKQAAIFNRIGRKPYTIKAIFGKVIIDRIRIRDKNGNRSQIPSSHAWETGQQAYTTKGLKSAICDLVVKESISETLEEIERRAGSTGWLSSRSILNILHAEGEALTKAQEARAGQVFKNIPEANSLIIKNKKKWHKGEKYLSHDYGYSEIEGEEIFGGRVVWSWEDGGQVVYTLPQRTEAEGLIIIQLDEVKVGAQPQVNKKEIWIYTGVVNANGRAYYFSAESATQLFFQVSGLLAVLGVHKGAREICVLADGARWIRNWYRELAVAGKTMVLCWFHLADICHSLLNTSFGREVGVIIKLQTLSYLWKGNVTGALKVITANQDKVINKTSYENIIKYLKARQPYIVNYERRQLDEQWISNNRVEKLNDWALATRCKEHGQKWTYEGVKSIAALVVARRNGELSYWRRNGELPEWED